MGDDHDRPPGELAQQPEHDGSVLGVEIAGRLIGEDELRVVYQGAGDRESLLLATGQLVRTVVGDRREPQLADQ